MLSRTESSTNNQRFIEYFSFLQYNMPAQWPSGLRRRSAAACLPRLWVRIPPKAQMFVCCECCVFSGRGLCDVLITRVEVSYRLWFVVVYDLETSWMRKPWSTGDSRAINKQTIHCIFKPSSPTNHFFSQVNFRSKVINAAEWKTRRGF